MSEKACRTCRHWTADKLCSNAASDECGYTCMAVARCSEWEEIEPTQTDNPVDHPRHYTAGGVECIDALKAATVGLQGIQAVCAANAIKYIWRFSRKNGAEDIDKAIWYLNRLKEELA